ncbi:MAG: hypothetical protein FJ098_08020 [Deltaproteobacteria bacterium]|nr:hypothetical protein [Deltaproteobacteria bacterium]
MHHSPRVLVFCTLAALLVPQQAQADIEDWLRFSGHVESDIRFIVEDHRGVVPGDGYRFLMNRNELRLALRITPSENVAAVVDTRLRLDGFNRSAELGELIDRRKLDPFELYLDEAYLFVHGFFWEGMDFKAGRMIQNWGRSFLFNPTDNLNSRDLSDPLNYAGKVPNQMVEIDLYPSDWLDISLIWVPVFKPAQLPASALLGFAVENDAEGCFRQAPIPPLSPSQVGELEELFSAMDPCALNFVNPLVRTVNPGFRIENSQAAVKANLRAGPVDMSLSYYYGRFGFPVALDAAALVDQGPETIDVQYVAEVMYPRIHVAGFDFAYSAPWLWGMGFFGELGVYFPERVGFGLLAVVDGERTVEMTSVNVPTTPFVKASAGFDQSFTPWFYANVMYVRGFFDEFNDRYGIHNYLSLAPEFRLFDTELQIRLAAVWSLDDMSVTLNPRVNWIMFPGAELTLTGLIFIGDTEPEDPRDYGSKFKFGQKAAGRSVVSLKAKVTW